MKAGKQRESILYVEDESTLFEVATFRLRHTYDLLHAADDRSACDILRSRGGELSAVLMDIQLMGSILDGIQLAQLIRGTLPESHCPNYGNGIAKRPDLPIVFVTAYAGRYEEPELLAAGGNLMIPKPVDFSRLTMALTNHYLQSLAKRR